VIVPAFVALSFLMGNMCFAPLSDAAYPFALALRDVVEREIWCSGGIRKVLSSVEVLLGVMSIQNAAAFPGAWMSAIRLLSSPFPKVRRLTAEKLADFLSVNGTCGGLLCSSSAECDRIVAVVTTTEWANDDRTIARRAARSIASLCACPMTLRFATFMDDPSYAATRARLPPFKFVPQTPGPGGLVAGGGGRAGGRPGARAGRPGQTGDRGRGGGADDDGPAAGDYDDLVRESGY
jgi:hypothetical protein